MNEAKLQQIGENLLPAIAYGDSLGLPVETKKRADIQQKYGYLKHLDNITNPYFGDAVAGTWSDDTQLSLAVADALIEVKGFSMPAIVEHHIKAMDETPVRQHDNKDVPRGWGASTWESVTRLKHTDIGHHYSGNPTGYGNGVLMKMAPLAVWQTLQAPRNIGKQIDSFARMTHDNHLSVLTARVHRYVLSMIMEGELEPHEVPRVAAEKAAHVEWQYKNNVKPVTSDLLGKLAVHKKPNADQILEIAPKGGFYSPETLVMAYGVFARTPQYPESVYEAVNLGGDTDSIASIVASMSILNDPNIKDPEDMHWIEDLGRLRQTSRQLIEMCIEEATQ